MTLTLNICNCLCEEMVRPCRSKGPVVKRFRKKLERFNRKENAQFERSLSPEVLLTSTCLMASVSAPFSGIPVYKI